MASPEPQSLTPDAPSDGPFVFAGLPSPHVLSALPDFALAAVYLIAWIAPGATQPAVLRSLVLTMLLEFIVMHSAAFTGQVMIGDLARGAKVRSLIGLGLFYSLFVGGFAAAFHTPWPLITFWLLMLNRMSPVLLGQAPSGEEKAFVQRSWAGSGVLYLLGVALTCVLPIPALGLSPDRVASLGLHGSGLWADQPWRVFAFGFGYFAGTGLLELDGFRGFRDGRVSGKRVG